MRSDGDDDGDSRTNTVNLNLDRVQFVSPTVRQTGSAHVAASAIVCVSFFALMLKRSSGLVCESFTFNLVLFLFLSCCFFPTLMNCADLFFLLLR